MNLSRRMFFSGAVALLAAPAIVKVESLMKLAPTEVLRADGVSLRMLDGYVVGEDQLVSRLDVLYSHVHVRPEWIAYVPEPPPFTLDEYSKHILAPMMDKLQKQMADAFMYGHGAARYNLGGIRSIALSDLLVEARSTHSIE